MLLASAAKLSSVSQESEFGPASSGLGYCQTSVSRVAPSIYITALEPDFKINAQAHKTTLEVTVL